MKKEQFQRLFDQSLEELTPRMEVLLNETFDYSKQQTDDQIGKQIADAFLLFLQELKDELSNKISE